MPDSSINPLLMRADELNRTGAHYHTVEGRLDVARLHYLAALLICPEHPGALQNLGAVLTSMEKYVAAVSVSRRAIALNPTNVYAKMNLAVALVWLRQYDEAIAIFESELKNVDNRSAMLHNYGLALYTLGRHAEALAAFEESLAIQPNVIQVQSDHALALLALGRLSEGLTAYEIRWQLLYKSPIWQLGVPEWRGQNLTGKRILIHHEQGYGDTIMLCRFIKQLNARGAMVTLAVPPPLMRLMSQSLFNELLTVVDWEDKELSASDYDFHSPLLSVVRWLDIQAASIDATPYLKAVGEPPLTLPPAKLRVGLCWASGDHGPQLQKRRRCIALEKFLPMTEIPGIKLFSLQKGNDEKELVDVGAEGIIFDSMGRVEDFADTAALIAKLDLVISVDSAVAHLAGALGKPTIMLSPFTHCWRWWGMESAQPSGRPWYNDMTALSQSEDGTWGEAVKMAIHLVQLKMKEHK